MDRPQILVICGLFHARITIQTLVAWLSFSRYLGTVKNLWFLDTGISQYMVRGMSIFDGGSVVKTRIINWYGGPGVGKSTLAAEMFVELKKLKHNAELVREYVKEWVWEDRTPKKYDQLYIAGKQVKKETMLYGKAEYVITDSPVILSYFYARRYSSKALADGIKAYAMALYNQAEADGFKHYHILVKRAFAYQPEGRFQKNLEDAIEIDNGITEMLQEVGFQVITFDPIGKLGEASGPMTKLVRKVLE